MRKESGTKGSMSLNTTERLQIELGRNRRWLSDYPILGSGLFGGECKASGGKVFCGKKHVSAREARRIKAIERALAQK